MLHHNPPQPLYYPSSSHLKLKQAPKYSSVVPSALPSSTPTTVGFGSEVFYDKTTETKFYKGKLLGKVCILNHNHIFIIFKVKIL